MTTTNSTTSLRLYVGNLAYDATEQDLRDNFAEAGEVTSLTIICDRETGQSKGFAFLEMASANEAAVAIEMLHGREIHGRPIRVSVAKPRGPRS